MRTKLKSYASLIGRARNAFRRKGKGQAPKTPMQFLDFELFQVDIRV